MEKIDANLFHKDLTGDFSKRILANSFEPLAGNTLLPFVFLWTAQWTLWGNTALCWGLIV